MNRNSLSFRRAFGVISILITALALTACVTEDPDVDDNDDNDEPTQNVDTHDCLAPGAFPTSIDGDTTVEADCYEIDSNVTIDDGTLTLEPGTVLVMYEDRRISVEGDGRLNAGGTEDEPIVITALEELPGFWRGIRFLNSNSSDNVFRNVVVEYAGGNSWSRTESANIQIDRARLELEDTLLRHSGGYGLFARDGDQSHLTMTGDNVFTENEAPMRVGDPNFVQYFSTDTDHTGNDEDVIYVGSGKVTDEATWEPLDVLYTVREIGIDDVTLTVAAGSELVFRQDGEVDVNDDGRLTISGTADDPVELRGLEDIAGYWRGIRYMGTNSTDNHLEYVVVRDGGSNDWSRASEATNLMVDNARVSGNNITLTNSGGVGIGSARDSIIEFDCDTLTNDDGSTGDDYGC